MCPVSNELFLSRLHFLKLERTIQRSKDGVKYVIKNHFDSPTVSVEGSNCHHQQETNNWEFDVIDLQAKKIKGDVAIVFHISVTTRDECVMTMTSSVSGDSMGRVVTLMKDVGLSTCIIYEFVDNENKTLYQVHKSEGKCELDVRLAAEQDIIARIGLEDDIITLSMAPELDVVAKMRLLCLMLFHHHHLIQESVVQ